MTNFPSILKSVLQSESYENEWRVKDDVTFGSVENTRTFATCCDDKAARCNLYKLIKSVRRITTISRAISKRSRSIAKIVVETGLTRDGLISVCAVVCGGEWEHARMKQMLAADSVFRAPRDSIGKSSLTMIVQGLIGGIIYGTLS